MYDTWILTILLAWPLVAAAVVLVRAGERHAVHPGVRLDPGVGHPLSRGRGRHFAVHGAAHHVSDAALGPGELPVHHEARARVLCAAPGAHDGDDRGVRLARSLPLLPAVGSDADADVLPHRGG